nr:reverse transcriptase domain-containing protein [Tanacetum cinerariifolium]
MMNLTTLPLSFWDYALESAKHILNMVLTKKVDKTPYELWYGKVPNLSYLKVWGCEALVKRDAPDKLQQRSVKSLRTHRAPERLCPNVEVEEHSLGDLNVPANYKVALLVSKSNKWLDAMNAEIAIRIGMCIQAKPDKTEHKTESCTCTRSSSNLPIESPPNPSTSNPKRRNHKRSKQPFILEESPVDTMADQRTMAELLRAPTEGYAEAIMVPLILAEQFELKHNLINMMTSDQLFGLKKDNHHDHIRCPSVAKKEPSRSILTWEDLVSKFINEFFPPSRTTNLRNEISNFQQRFDESFHEAWDRYNDLLRACPHHGFTELHQLDTFYNALNPANQDSLNSATGGNLLERRTQDVLTIIKNKSKVRNS